MKKHKTKQITIKTANIDVKMVPIVEWLNRYPDVITTSCCQGDRANLPYVYFLSASHLSLAQICEVMSTIGTVSVYFSNGALLYKAIFEPSELNGFVSRIRTRSKLKSTTPA